MGSSFKKGMFDEELEKSILSWADRSKTSGTRRWRSMSQSMTKEPTQLAQIDEHAITMVEDATTSTIELPTIVQAPLDRPSASNSNSLTNVQ